MLADLPNQECSRCYLLESKTSTFTLRKYSLATYGRHWPSVCATKTDGTVDEVNMAYLDIRFSNLCNFSCRTCGHSLSSSWYNDQLALYGDPGHEPTIRLNQSGLLSEKLRPHLLNVEAAYFAGGEPMLCDEIFEILDYWLEHDHTDIGITYNTNFSLLNKAEKNIIDYWKSFPRSRVSASLDASGSRAEFLRKGTKWEKIVQNRILMKKECPSVYFEITPTISLYNVWHFPDFHKEWIKAGLVEPNALRVNILTAPSDMSIQVLPAEAKQEVERKYRKTLADILASAGDGETQNLISGYSSVIEFMNDKDDSDLIMQFLSRTKLVDKRREEQVFTSFPELESLLRWKKEN